jgi:acetyl esterase/lipase
MADVTAAPVNLNDVDPLEIRRMQDEFEAVGLKQLKPLSSELVEKVISINVSSDFRTQVKLIHPAKPSSAARPLIVLFYGGGFRAGSFNQLTEPGRTFASQFNAVVVLGSYRMVPEVRWPVPFKDGWKLLVHLSQHTSQPEWGGAELSPTNGGGFVVGGVSAGASIAAVCAGTDALNHATSEGMVPLSARITAVMANVPWLITPEIIPDAYTDVWTSWADNENVDGFNLLSLKGVMLGLACSNYSSPWFSPIPGLLQSPKPLENHPRVFVTICQMDPLRDDGKIYCSVLESKGVEVKLVLFPDDGHNAWTVVPRPRNSTNPTFEEATLEGMRWLLSSNEETK